MNHPAAVLHRAKMRRTSSNRREEKERCGSWSPQSLLVKGLIGTSSDGRLLFVLFFLSTRRAFLSVMFYF